MPLPIPSLRISPNSRRRMGERWQPRTPGQVVRRPLGRPMEVPEDFRHREFMEPHGPEEPELEAELKNSQRVGRWMIDDEDLS